jgi:anti-sigma regulatory factor (Ser/Thr protein kinase)
MLVAMTRPEGQGELSAVADWAADALATLSELSAVRRVGIALIEGGGRRLQFTASDRVADTGVDASWCYVDAYADVPLNTALRSGEPVLGTLDELAAPYHEFVARQRATSTVALAALPLMAAHTAVGGVVLFFDEPQRLDAAQERELAAIAADLATRLRRAQRREARTRQTLLDEPAPPTAEVDGFEVLQHPTSVSQARRSVRATLEEWAIDEELVDEAVLCLSELVTNALMHTSGGCSVRAVLDRGVLTIAVRDGGAAQGVSVELPEDMLRVHGRGLQIVDALASRWGSELDSVGTTVWCTFDDRSRAGT